MLQLFRLTASAAVLAAALCLLPSGSPPRAADPPTWRLQPQSSHPGFIATAAFTGDGRHLVTSGEGGLRTWSWPGLDIVSAFDVETLSHRALAVVGRTAYIATIDGIQAIDLATRTARRVVASAQHLGHSLQASADGAYLAATTYDANRVFVWSTRTWQQIHLIDSPSTILAISPDSKHLYSGGTSGFIEKRSLQTGELLARMEVRAPGQISSLAVSRDGRSIAAATDANSVLIIAAADGRVSTELRGHAGVVNSLEFSSDGKQLVSASSDGTVRLWDVASGGVITELKAHISARGTSSWARWATIRGSEIVTAGGDGEMRVWNRLSGTETKAVLGKEVYVTAAAVSGDRSTVATAYKDGSVVFWSNVTGRVVKVLKPFATGPNQLALSYAGDVAAASTHNHEPVSVLTRDGTVTRCRSGEHGDARRGLELSHDGSHIFLLTDRLRIFATATCALVHDAGPIGSYPRHLRLSPDGKLLAAQSNNDNLALFRTSPPFDQRPAYVRLTGLQSSVRHIGFSADGRYVGIVDDTGKAFAWSVPDGAELDFRKENSSVILGEIRRRIRARHADTVLDADDADRVRLSFVRLPENHWLAIAGDDRTYTASPGAERYLRLSNGIEARALDEPFMLAHRRDRGLP